jgi:hypothetical protein
VRVKSIVRTSYFKRGAGILALAVLTGYIALHHYHTGLCNGYRLVRMNGYEVVIAKPNNEVLTSGTVTMFAVRPPYITGYTSSEHMAPETEPVDGYFIIDTTKGTINDGLTGSVWREQLSKLDWEHPALRRPW